jgi:hypothetical protein
MTNRGKMVLLSTSGRSVRSGKRVVVIVNSGSKRGILIDSSHLASHWRGHLNKFRSGRLSRLFLGSRKNHFVGSFSRG